MRRLTSILVLIAATVLFSVPCKAEVNPADVVSGIYQATQNPGNHTIVLYTVPAGFQFVLTDVHFTYYSITSTITTYSNIYLREDSTDKWFGRVFQSVTPVLLNYPLIQDFTTGLVFDEGKDVTLFHQLGGNNSTGWSLSWSGYLVSLTSAGIETGEVEGPGLVLDARPNPSDNETEISFQLSTPENVILAIFDVQGRRIRTLHEGPMEAGVHTLVWDGRNEASQPASDGVYFARLISESGSESRKLTLRP